MKHVKMTTCALKCRRGRGNGKKEKLAESLWEMGKKRVQDEIPNDKFHTIVLLLCNRESLRSSQLSPLQWTRKLLQILMPTFHFNAIAVCQV